MKAPAQFDVRWAAAAEADLAAIVAYIAQADPRTARLLLQEIRAQAEALYTLPHRGRVVPELHAHGVTLFREIIHPPWRIIYRIEAAAVHVLTVLDARRNLEDVLLERLVRSDRRAAHAKAPPLS